MTSPASSFAPSARIPNSVFISYASADRAAAKKLHDALAGAHLDVWLDDEELAGGEAWDAKIRHQIRTCTYFMPVISATTETRGEGYFRREWRLAVERTLDLADDVLFLVPVVIDDTSEHGARVPDKFGMVQWLRCQGGIETPALAALARRMAGGTSETHVAALPSASSSGLRHGSRSHKLLESDSAPIPYRAFPAFPSPGQHLRFVYDVTVWAGYTLYAVWLRLPRAIRLLLLTIMFFRMLKLISQGR